MNPGRELDALVAEKVMEMEYREWKPYCAPAGWYAKTAPPCNDRNDKGEAIDHPSYQYDLPLYSTDIAAAWAVVEKLRKSHGIAIAVYEDGSTRVELSQDRLSHHPNNIFEGATTAPHAICLAALKACGVDL